MKTKEDMLAFERECIKNGKNIIAGMDEAGRGPLAGPVVCACVIMPVDNNSIIDGVNDSKQLSAKKREELFEKIKNTALEYSIVEVDEKTIDDINILQATKVGMKKSIENLKQTPELALVDAVKDIDSNVDQIAIIKAGV